MQANAQPASSAAAAAAAGPARQWLSKDFSELATRLSQACPPFDVVVVGSGYGGAVAAAQLADLNNTHRASGTPPLRVCMLERGTEFLPGMFPSRLSELPAQVRFSTRDRGKPRGSLQGLFDFRLGPDACALVANGLGGGSLINGAVMEKPKFGQFPSRMPANVEQELNDTYLDVALVMLEAATPAAGVTAPLVNNTIELHSYIVAQGPLPKTAALGALAHSGLGDFRPAAITIEMLGGVNAHGVYMRQCTLCGDCVTGCNVGARRSLDTNLLVQARNSGVEIFTGVSVLRLERQGGHWRLELVPTQQALREQYGAPSYIDVSTVILAAGTFGSTEILLRSQTDGMRFSSRLGEQFSCNGDNFSAIADQQKIVRTTASETQPLEPAAARAVGPTITGVIDVAASADAPPFLIQEFAVPAPLKRLFDELVTTGGLLSRLAKGDYSRHSKGNGEPDPLAVDAGAMNRTALVGLIGHDAANGHLSLPSDYIPGGRAGHGSKQEPYEGSLRIEWPRAGADPLLNAAYARFDKHAATLGNVVPNPLWRPLPSAIEAVATQGYGPTMTVHPLGGCPMGAESATGVVDSHGQVFDCTAGSADKWEGTLLVLDGSILPASLGANPALTIAALAIRAMRFWRDRWAVQGRAAASELIPITQLLHVPLKYPRPVYRTPARCINTEARPAKVQVVERLTGEVRLKNQGGKPYMIELTFAFVPTTLGDMTGRMGRVLEVDHRDDATQTVNCLRVFDKVKWDIERLDLADDTEREKTALVSARLTGHLQLLDREPSRGWWRVVRGLWAYLRNRGLRDIWQRWRERPTATTDRAAPRAGWLAAVVQGIRLASFAGEVRRFDYGMEVASILHGSTDLVPVGSVIGAHKRFTYSRRGNPWNQLLYLELVKFPRLAGPALLKLDARFLARRCVALARLTEQEDQPSALAEVASFGAYGLRLMLSIHAWSFRTPDVPAARTPQLQPGPLPGMPEPHVREIELEPAPAPGHESVRVRLTRYAQPYGVEPHESPLVLIHGYSASGTTFAHPSLKPSMAEYFWKRGRDVWILDLRTSASMSTAKMPWSFEDVAWADIPVAIEHIVNHVGNERAGHSATAPTTVDVFAHCVGAVMLSMALLTEPMKLGGNTPPRERLEALRRLPSYIRKIVLSQKGFVLSYTDANVLRAYLMRYLRQVILPDQYQFQAAAQPSAADKLVDRLLAALPYPVHEFDRENPIWPWMRTPWTATRHRMDALYERTMNVDNVSDQVLEHIDDFFGPLNIDTVSQTIHFARYNSITNAQGRNYFVTKDAILRWPRGGTLSIHCRDNGMVDRNGLTLMMNAMNVGKIPFCVKLLDDQTGHTEVGHQDGLIGVDAEKTFRVVDEFFNDTEPQPSPVKKSEQVLEVPWRGPRIHITPCAGTAMANGPTDHDAGEIQLLIAADPGRAETQALVVPVVVSETGFEALPSDTSDFTPVGLRPYSGWLALALKPHLRPDAAGYLVLMRAVVPGKREFNFPYPLKMLSEPHLRRLVESDVLTLSTPLASEFGQRRENVGEGLGTPVGEKFRNNKPAADLPRQTYAAAFVSSEAISNLLPRTTKQDSVTFALASCQYPAGILDSQCASASIERMDKMVTSSPTDGGIEAVLMVGDQIYADATAGLFDPTTANDRYGRSYEEWLGAPALRRLMRRVPVHVMLDDHEIEDNWEPYRSKQSGRNREAGIQAYWQWQRGVVQPDPDAPLWYEAAAGEFNVFMADTRSERRSRRPDLTLAGSAQIMGQAQMQALQQWLRDQKAQHDISGKPIRPKFIASPAWLLPRRVGAMGEAESPACCDGWEGYPTSMHQLLGFIAMNDIRGVVVLSGDSHLGYVALARIHAAKAVPPIRLVCINAPPMYAPYPFANKVAEDYLLRDRFSVGTHPDIQLQSRAWQMGKGDGFVQVKAALEAGRWKITANFVAASGGEAPLTFDVK